MLLRMMLRRMTIADWLVTIGGVLLGLGILLLLVRLVIELSYFAPIVAVLGVVLLLAGKLLGRQKGPRDEGQDGIPYF